MGAVSGTGGHLIDNNLKALGKVGEIAANAVLSGTVDEIGGGKFANGAITGAYSVMFNDLMHNPNKTKVEPSDMSDNDDHNELAAGLFVVATGMLADDVTGFGVVDDVVALGVYAVAIAIEGYHVITIYNNRVDKSSITVNAEHTKGARNSTRDKHTKTRSGISYGQNRNMSRGDKNKKHEHPMNPNKRKRN